MLRTIFLITFIFASNAFASDESRVWFYQSFPDITAVMASDTNPQGVIYELCRAKSNTNLTNATQPSYADGDTAFGHYTAGVASTNQVNGNTWQCVYGSATPEDDNLYYLYVYAEEPCDEGSTYDREKRACIKPNCVSGEKNLLSGFSYPLIASNGSAYIADQTPESVCAKTPDSSSSCTYNKPAFSHSCYADSPLSWDDGNLSGSYTGHCNYQFVNSGNECKLTSNSLPTAWGGYSLNSSDQSGDMTCADGITSPGCPTDGGNGGDGGSGGTGGDGGSGGTGGDGNGGTGGDGGGGTGDNGGTGGDGNGNGGSVSGTACGAALACTGDAIQCAILAQQKKSSCALEKFTATDDSAASSMLTGEKFQLDERTIEATSFFERTRFLTESCPAPVVFSLSFGTFDFDFDLICDFAHILSNLIVLGATLLALMIVFKD